ncbi:MAG: hypothetical protein KGQ66_13135 [Acidobacteriota bacterium]|nr:hypothetical protein [Acidobacteriota bacterium]
MRHGAYSERKVGPLAEEIEAALPAMAPWVSRPAFTSARRRRCRALAVAELLWRDIVENGVVDEHGNVRAVVDAFHKWETNAANRDAALGLDPVSFARLLQTFSATEGADDVLERLRAEGAAIVAARTPVGELPAVDPGDLPDADRLDTPADRLATADGPTYCPRCGDPAPAEGVCRACQGVDRYGPGSPDDVGGWT